MSILTNISAPFKCIVSSVLNKDVKQHGKNFLFDGKEDTAWSSDQGMPQWIQIKFEQPVTLKSFNFMFQGGFSGTKLIVASESAASSSSKQETFYPEDINKIQEFQLNELHENIDKIRFTFETCSDFFGRIIVYQLDLF